jgi:hypothetical protein
MPPSVPLTLAPHILESRTPTTRMGLTWETASCLGADADSSSRKM